MRLSVIILSALLWIWFLGCTISWRFGKVVLVNGEGVKSLEFGVLVLFSVGMVLYILFEPVGKWVLLSELVLWLVIQFFCHEYFTIFGVSERKLSGYNQCFEGTVKLFPISETRLIPDLYHIVLHILLAVDLGLLIADMI